MDSWILNTVFGVCLLSTVQDKSVIAKTVKLTFQANHLASWLTVTSFHVIAPPKLAKLTPSFDRMVLVLICVIDPAGFYI